MEPMATSPVAGFLNSTFPVNASNPPPVIVTTSPIAPTVGVTPYTIGFAFTAPGVSPAPLPPPPFPPPPPLPSSHCPFTQLPLEHCSFCVQLEPPHAPQSPPQSTPVSFASCTPL